MHAVSPEWWHRSVVPALGLLRQENGHEFAHLERLYVKDTKVTTVTAFMQESLSCYVSVGLPSQLVVSDN